MTHSYTIESVDSLMDSLIQKTRQTSNNKLTKFSQNSVTRALLYAFANSLSMAKGYIGVVETRRFLSSCYGADLDNYAKEYYGEQRRKQSKSSAEVFVTADNGTFYPAGTTFRSLSGIEFKSLEDTTITRGFAFIEVESAEYGSKTKVYAQTITKVSETIQGHIFCTNFSPAIGGYDVESDEEFRQRLYLLPQKIASDTPAKIEAIAYELISDLGKAQCYATSYGMCFLGVLKTSGASYSKDECQQIKNMIQQYLTYSAAINLDVRPLNKLYLDIAFEATIKPSSEFDSAFEEIQAALLAYLDPRFYNSTSIRVEKIIQLISDIDDIMDLNVSSISLRSDILTPKTVVPFIRTLNITLKKDTGSQQTLTSNIPQAYYSEFNPNTTALIKEYL